MNSGLHHELICSPSCRAALEPMIVNLAHVLRKQRRFEQAERHYLTALSFAPSQAGTLAALAYTCLLQVLSPHAGYVSGLCQQVIPIVFPRSPPRGRAVPVALLACNSVQAWPFMLITGVSPTLSILRCATQIAAKHILP